MLFILLPNICDFFVNGLDKKLFFDTIYSVSIEF